MDFDYKYIDEQDKLQGLRLLANGQLFSVFKMLFANLSDKDAILHDKEVVLNMAHQLKGDELDEFIDFYNENSHEIGANYSPGNPQVIKKIRQFWGKDINFPLPFFMCLGPLLSDKQFAKLLKDGDNLYLFSEENEEERLKQLKQELVLCCFRNGYGATVEAACKRHLLYSVDLYGRQAFIEFDEPKPLQDVLKKYFYKDPSLLNAYKEMCFDSSAVESWMIHQVSQEKIDIPLVKKFIDNHLQACSSTEQERFMSWTLCGTTDTKLLKYALKKLGYSSISHYEPTQCKLWKNITDHKSREIFSTFLNAGTPLFDMDLKSSSLFVRKMIEFHVANSALGYQDKPWQILFDHGISKEQYEKELLVMRTNQDGQPCSNFSLLSAYGPSDMLELLNIDLCTMPLQCVDAQWQGRIYEQLSHTEKVLILEQTLRQMFTHPQGHEYFTMFFACAARNNQPLWIVQEYARLLQECTMPAAEDIAGLYLNTLCNTFTSYRDRRMNEDAVGYELYRDILTICCTCHELDWKALNDHLATVHKDNLSDKSFQLYTEMGHAVMDKLLTPSLEGKKKFKL